MDYVYRATFTADPEGGYLVTFADVPEAITQGDDLADALASGREALGLALRGVLADGRDLPQPSASEGVAVAVEPETALKLAVILAFREANISKTELARRLGKGETEARRILDADHGTKAGLLTEALRALGRDVVISVRAAA